MAKTSHILKAVEQLEQALGGESAGRIEQTLAALQEALRQRAATLKPPDDPLPDVDRPLLPSPGEDRKAAELREQVGGFLWETEALRAQARDGGAEADAFRERARALRNHEHAEVDLILESVNTDIGAGD